MRYQGSKSRISKEISAIISQNASNDFVSLFCGSCAIESKVAGFNKIICNDSHSYLIDLFNGVKNGYELPEYISKDDYKYIREHKDEDKILTGFVGFCYSFGGKWFGGYAQDKNNRNYASESKRSLLKDMKTLMTADFINLDYRDVVLPENCVVYADPPYNNTTGYGGGRFNSDDFWKYMRKISETHLVFISEQEAPIDFIPIWEKPFTRTLDCNKSNQFKVTEKLFVHKCNIEKVKI